MLKYAALTVANLLFTAVAYLLAPLVAVFCKSDGYLPNWLCWFQTFDAPLDAGWHDGYFGLFTDPPKGFALYWLRVRWLWRNPAYGYCYWELGIDFDQRLWRVLVDYTNGPESLFVASDGLGHFCVMYGGQYGSLKLGWKASHQYLGHGQFTDQPWGPELRIPIAFTPNLHPLKVLALYKEQKKST